MDCPGVIHNDGADFNLLRNVIKVDDIVDPVEPC